MFKYWGTGDIVRDEEIYDGTTTYNTIEGFVGDDRVSFYDFNRSIRNLWENENETFEYLSSVAKTKDEGNAIFKSSIGGNEFSINTTTDILTLDFDGTYYYYVRVAPGILHLNDEIFISIPQTRIAERQLESILGLRTSLSDPNTEYVNISYSEQYDNYQARIHYNGANVDFTNTGTWGVHSANSYDTGIELIKAIYDNVTFKPLMNAALGEDLTLIKLEPVTELASAAGATTRFIGFNSSLEFVNSATSLNSASGFDLYEATYTATAGAASISANEDHRTFFQNSNDFRNEVYFNVPNTFDSTDDTASGAIDRTKVSDSDVELIVLRPDGATGGDAVIKWNETADQFEIDKRLVITDSSITNVDTTAGRTLEFGDFGIGNRIVFTEVDADNYTDDGIYLTPDSGHTNFPITGNNGNALMVVTNDGTYFRQFLYQTEDINRFYSRSGLTTNIASISWVEILHTDNTGTAVTHDVQTSLTDTTADRLMKVGAGGVVTPIQSGGTVDLNTLIVPGAYSVEISSATNAPEGTATMFGVMHVMRRTTADRVMQMFVASGAATATYIRNQATSSTWSAWVELWHSGNAPEVTELEAEAGTEAANRTWSPLRVRQAIDAKYTEATLFPGTPDPGEIAYRTDLGVVAIYTSDGWIQL